MTALAYVYNGLAALGWVPAMSPAADTVVTFSTYAIAVVGLLCWPRAPLSRSRWWQFALDATIGAAGMSLFLVVLATLPGTSPSVGAVEQLSVLTFGAAQLLDLLALNSAGVLDVHDGAGPRDRQPGADLVFHGHSPARHIQQI